MIRYFKSSSGDICVFLRRLNAEAYYFASVAFDARLRQCENAFLHFKIITCWGGSTRHGSDTNNTPIIVAITVKGCIHE